MKKIIIYSEISWNFLDQRHHHLARYLAEQGTKVEFVQRVFSRTPSIKFLIKKIFSDASSLKKAEKKLIHSNIYLRRSFFLPNTNPFFVFYNYMLWIFFERYKQKDACVYSFVDNNIIAGGSLKLISKYSFSVFDIIHNWWEYPWNSERHKVLVQKCLDTFDKIVTDSPAIQKKLNKQDIQSHLMLPAVSMHWFDVKTNFNPKEIKPVFFGNLRTNSDINLINAFSKISPVDLYGLIDSEITNLDTSANIMGVISSENLPLTLSKYNLILLPYDNRSFSASISPAKYFESMSTGSLIVTRANFEPLPGFNDYCLKLDEDMLIKLNENKILESLSNHHKAFQKQREFSMNHCWNTRFDNLRLFLDIK